MTTHWKIGDCIPGQHGNYQIDRVVGGQEDHVDIKSGMGVVYIVFDPDLRAILALKTFQDRFMDSDPDREAFKQEALTWIYMDRHPNIVRAHWVEEIGGRLYIVLEYIAHDEAGRNCLTHYLKTGPLPPEQILRWAFEFCDGMQHARGKGMVCHRDIKPDNIMITTEGTVKVTDFGLAGAVTRSYGLEAGPPAKGTPDSGSRLSVLKVGKGMVCGTPGYIAPEVLRGEGAGVHSDVFSFGVVLYQMVTGSRWSPFYRNPFERTFSVQQIPQISRNLWPVIDRCLDCDLARRFPDFGELRSDLQEVSRRTFGQLHVSPAAVELEASEWNSKGVSLAELGHFEEAVKAYDEALKRNSQGAKFYNNKGIAMERLERNEDAVACYDKAIEIDPGLAMAWNNRGNALDSLNRVEEALLSYNRALAIDPGYDRALNNKGWVLMNRLNDNDEALRCFANATQINPNYDGAWNNQGLALMNLERNEEALTCFRTAVKIDPRHRMAWSNMGALFYKLDRHAEALEVCKRAVEIAPDSFRAWNNFGLPRQALGHHDKALACFDRALGIETNHIALFNKGQSLFSLERTIEAVSCYQHAIRLSPVESNYYDSLGTALQAIGDWPQARLSHAKAIELNPTEPIPHFNLAAALTGLGDITGAIAELRKAIAINPRFAQAYHNLGANLHRISDYREATEAYKKAIDLDAGNPRSFHNLALSLAAVERSSEALGNYRKAIELKPDYAEAHYNLGVLLLKQEKNDLAKESLLKAVEFDPNHYQAWTNLAVANYQQGDRRAAIDCWQKALKINPDFYPARANLETAQAQLAKSPTPVNEPIWQLEFKSNPNLQRVAVGGAGDLVGVLASDHCELWELSKGTTPAYFEFPWEDERRLSQKIFFSLDGSKLVAAGGRTFLIYTRATRGLSTVTLGQPILGIWISPDNRYLAIQQPGHFHIWRIGDDAIERVHSFPVAAPPLGSLDFFAFNGELIALPQNGPGFEVREVRTNTVVQSLDYPCVFAVAPRFSRDAKNLFALTLVDKPYTLVKWQINSGKVEETMKVKGPEEGLSSISFSPVGSHYAGIRESDKTIEIFHTRSHETTSLGNNQGRHLVFSPDGDYLAAMGFDDVFSVWQIA